MAGPRWMGVKESSTFSVVASGVGKSVYLIALFATPLTMRDGQLRHT